MLTGYVALKAYLLFSGRLSHAAFFRSSHFSPQEEFSQPGSAVH